MCRFQAKPIKTLAGDFENIYLTKDIAVQLNLVKEVTSDVVLL